MKVFTTQTIDELGRILISKEIRTAMGILEKEPLNISIDAGRIVITKNKPTCKICNTTENLIKTHHKNIYICSDCKKEICDLH